MILTYCTIQHKIIVEKKALKNKKKSSVCLKELQNSMKKYKNKNKECLKIKFFQ